MHLFSFFAQICLEFIACQSAKFAQCAWGSKPSSRLAAWTGPFTRLSCEHRLWVHCMSVCVWMVHGRTLTSCSAKTVILHNTYPLSSLWYPACPPNLQSCGSWGHMGTCPTAAEPPDSQGRDLAQPCGCWSARCCPPNWGLHPPPATSEWLAGSSAWPPGATVSAHSQVRNTSLQCLHTAR